MRAAIIQILLVALFAFFASLYLDGLETAAVVFLLAFAVPTVVFWCYVKWKDKRTDSGM